MQPSPRHARYLPPRLIWMLALFLLSLASAGCLGPGFAWPTLPPQFVEPTATTTRPTATSMVELPPPPERAPEARVVRVVDGDTIVVAVEGVEYTVRYIGIDTPETVHPDRPVEYMGPEASAANAALVQGETVRLEKDVSETDRFGRLLRYVWVDGTMVNAELVRRGYAQASRYPPDVKYAELLRDLEAVARREERGLWGAPPDDAAATSAPVVIETIHYNGDIDPNEPDEYCQILNEGAAPVSLTGWRLNADDPGQDFIFPEFTLGAGEACRVYTDQVHPEWGGLSFGSGQSLWANGGECGRLYDAAGHEVSVYCYGE